MMLEPWDKLPEYMRNEKVKPYYDSLSRKKNSLALKRIFDVVMSVVLFILLLPIIAAISIWIKLDSKGPVFFRQVRITAYGRKFRIYKFRTMVENAEALGSQVTSQNDMRVTRVGEKIRRLRLDELPQLINIFKGEMSFVGTRPEVPRYVKQYSPEMYATLLLPAGVTSEASIEYKDEDELLRDASNADEIYIKEVIPGKMIWNLKEIREFSFFKEIKILFRTVGAVLK